MTRIAVISFAHVHAESYLTVLRDRADVTLIACDPDGDDAPDRGRALADRVGVPYAATLDEVVAFEPDGVVITAENADHRRTVEWAAAHGLHVLCEKPLATTVADGRAMIEACDRAGVTLMVAYPARFSPAFAELRKVAADPRFGRLLAAHGSNNGKSPVGTRAWFGDPQRAGGGAIMDHTVHLADLLDVLLDGTPAASVYAQANDLLHAPLTEVETAGVVSVTYADGTFATIECGWTHPEASPVWGGLDLTVTGEGATVEFDAFPALIEGFDAHSALAIVGAVDLDALMVDEFLTAIAERRPARPDGRSGLRSLAIVEAAYRSWRSGAPAAIDPATLEVPSPIP